MRSPFSSIPSRIVRKFTYGDYFPLAPGGAVVSLQTFRMNSIYDPDVTGVGGTPSGVAQWCSATAIYQYYRVISARTKAIFHNTCNTPVLAGIMYTPVTGILPTSGVTAQQALLEAPNATACFLTPQASNYKHTQTVERYDTVSNVVGRDVSRDNDYASLYNNNPTICPFITTVVGPADGATANVTVGMLITIEYTVELSMANPGIVD